MSAFSGLGFEIPALSSTKGRRLFCASGSDESASFNDILCVSWREFTWPKGPPPAFREWHDGEGTSDDPEQEMDSYRKGECPLSWEWEPGPWPSIALDMTECLQRRSPESGS